MGRPAFPLIQLFNKLESRYGVQETWWPTEPYEFLIWWHCGYPASDAACTKGWESLNREIGIAPQRILSASTLRLARLLKAGGMIPELRAMRMQQIAARVQDEFAGDLRSGLAGPIASVRKALKKFPGIADPGADRILLFAGIAPVAAVPSNATQVLERIHHAHERVNYGLRYRDGQALIEAGIPAKLDARMRAYLLLKRHAQEICKHAKPKCSDCPVSGACAFFTANRP